MTTSKKASQPLRRFRARRSRSLAARRSAVGWCTGSWNGRRRSVDHGTRRTEWAGLGLGSGHRCRHHLGHFVVGAVAPLRPASSLPRCGAQLTGELRVIGQTLLERDASAPYLSQQDFASGCRRFASRAVARVTRAST